jgi:hypothetical protein
LPCGGAGISKGGAVLFSIEVYGVIGGVLSIIAGFIIFMFPRILNYIIGVFLLIAGILWLANGDPVPGIVTLFFGILVVIFPVILNYLVAIYLILLGVWLILYFGLIAGIVTVVFGVAVIFFPAILNYLFGLYLILLGAVAIANYYGVDAVTMLLP